MRRNMIAALILASALRAAVPLEGFSEVVEKVSPAVVGITVSREVGFTAEEFNFDFDKDKIPEELRKFFKFWQFEPPQPHSVPGSGSGVIFDETGYVLTNNHVVADAEEITVKLADGSEYSGKDVEVVGTDPETDLAVLKLKTSKSLPAAKLANSDEVKVGDWAVAIGNPYNLEHTITVGVISAKGRSNVALYGGPAYQDFIQTDAAINPGNSGGPLCNIRGEVIGINTAIRTAGLVNSGIGFAIPSNMAAEIAAELVKNGRVSRGYIGIYLSEASADALEALGIEEKGVFVSKVIADSPADEAGLERGDLITSFAGEKITSVDQLRWLAASTEPGTKVKIDVIRDGKPKTLTVKLEERPAREELSIRPEPQVEPKEAENLVLGVTVRDLTAEEKRDYEVEQGVIVERVKAGSLADRAGIQPGDVLVKVNKTPVSDVRELKRLKGDLEKSEIILFQINRRGHTHFLTIRP